MRYRPYTPADEPVCLAIFDSNTPRFFAPAEREMFAKFLAAPPGFYGVLCDEAGAVIGCGGVGVRPETGCAVLTWRMVHVDLHRRGFGRALLHARLRHLTETSELRTVVVNTGKLTTDFYQKHGFHITQEEPDPYVPGGVRVRMELSLD